MTRKGCDYSFAHPDPQGLRADGFTFAVRYMSRNPAKDITLAEIHALNNADIDVVLNWESTEVRPRSGHAGGVDDAHTVQARLPGLQVPDGRPVYFSIDYPEAFAEIDVVRQYIRGATDVLGHDRVGVYGTYNVIRALAGADACKYLWQTESESQGHWFPGVHLQQVAFGWRIAGGELDVDQAIELDFGQWRLGGVVTHTWTDTIMDNLPVIKQGTSGDPVRRAQALLVAAGYTINIDGVFGAHTDSATRALQSKYGIGVDGVWGRHTYAVALTGRDL